MLRAWAHKQNEALPQTVDEHGNSRPDGALNSLRWFFYDIVENFFWYGFCMVAGLSITLAAIYWAIESIHHLP